MSHDPWDTRSDDEIEGVVWPAPGPITPEMEKMICKCARQMGEAFKARRVEIMMEAINGS